MSAMHRILRQITERRRERLLEAGMGPWTPPPEAGPPAQPLDSTRNGFLASLERRRGRAVIAEVKLGSPRLGSLAGRLDVERQARAYRDHGAAAISVVVEPDFFFGSYELLACCREISGLPAIAKDFVVHPQQIDWAAEAGAEAVLLIAALLSPNELTAHAEHARRLGVVPLVETHRREELRRLGSASWELVGVNNRDLETFEVDLQHSIGLVGELPNGCLKVAESGIKGADEIGRLRGAGFDAFLIGESLLLAEDPGRLLRELTR